MQQTSPVQPQPVVRPPAAVWVGILSGMTLWGLLAFNDAVWHSFESGAGNRLSQSWVLGAFIAVVLIHVGEALYAYALAKRSGRAHAALGWLVQTFFIGVPSLKLLHAQVRGQKP